VKILLVTQYFWPENFIINDLVETLESSGHTLKVLTGKPNYPSGEIFDGYSQSESQTELFVNNVSVFRVPLRPRKKGGAVNLLLNYLSFVWNGLRHFPRAVKGDNFDVILVFAPSPITMVIPAIYLKWKLKSHLAIWIQDLWPESLSATGFVRNKWVLNLVGVLVRWIYSRADSLLIQSEAFRKPVEKYAGSGKIVYYPNSLLRPDGIKTNAQELLSAELLEVLNSNFCVVFAGNLGKAQALETIVSAATRLIDNKEIKIVLVGSGSMLDWVLAEKERLNLSNLVAAGRFPSSVMPSIYKHSGALLVTLKNEEIFSYTIPSKVQACLAASKPIIASINGETARVIEEAKAGITCAAEDADALADAIINLYEMDSDSREMLGSNGHRYFVEHFEMNRQAKKLIELLESRISGKREVK
jgi:glycosyltransferase involved in cell wall biosynthesis